MSKPTTKGQDEFRTAITMTVIWVAALTLAVIFAALFAGLLLDRLLHTRPLFTILLILISVPVNMYLTFKVVQIATRRIPPTTQPENTQEVLDRDRLN